MEERYREKRRKWNKNEETKRMRCREVLRLMNGVESSGILGRWYGEKMKFEEVAVKCPYHSESICWFVTCQELNMGSSYDKL